MKKALLIAAVITLLPISITLGQELQEGDFAAIAFGSAFTDASFKDASGGAKFGIQSRIDQDKNIWLRTIYSQFSVVGEKEPVETLEGSGLIKWWIGKKWEVYWTTGVNAYIDGPNTDASFFTGFGASRRVWTGNKETGIPPSLSVFGEVSFTDADEQPTGSFVQLNLGVAFNRGK